MTVTKSADRFTSPISAGRFADWQIWWQSLNLPADLHPSRFTDWQIWWICQQIYPHLPGRFGEGHKICQQIYPPPADLLTGRFGEGHKICQQIYPQADLLTGRFGESASIFPPGRFPQQIYWLADLVTVTKSASRFTDWQIWWQSLNLPADLHPSRFTDWQIWWICQQISPPHLPGRFGEGHKICQQIYPPPADLLTGRFGDGHKICQQIYPQADSPQQIYWLADLVTVTKSADRFTSPISAGRFADWQIWWQSLNLPEDIPPANLLTGRIGESASRFPPWEIPPSRFTDWQIWWQSLNLPADLPPAYLLTGRFGESASRFTPKQIYWLVYLVNLPADFPLADSPLGDSPQQIYWVAVW